MRGWRGPHALQPSVRAWHSSSSSSATAAAIPPSLLLRCLRDAKRWRRIKRREGDKKGPPFSPLLPSSFDTCEDSHAAHCPGGTHKWTNKFPPVGLFVVVTHSNPPRFGTKYEGQIWGKQVPPLPPPHLLGLTQQSSPLGPKAGASRRCPIINLIGGFSQSLGRPRRQGKKVAGQWRRETPPNEQRRKQNYYGYLRRKFQEIQSVTAASCLQGQKILQEPWAAAAALSAINSYEILHCSRRTRYICTRTPQTFLGRLIGFLQQQRQLPGKRDEIFRELFPFFIWRCRGIMNVRGRREYG